MQRSREVSIWFPENLLLIADALADTLGMSRSEFVRQAVVRHIEASQETMKLLTRLEKAVKDE